jgi:hypothetical protein
MDLALVPLSDPWITSFTKLKSMVYILARGTGGQIHEL